MISLFKPQMQRDLGRSFKNTEGKRNRGGCKLSEGFFSFDSEDFRCRTAKKKPLWPFLLGGLFRCLYVFPLRFGDSLSYLCIIYSVYNRFNWFDYQNTRSHVYMWICAYIYIHTYSVFNIKIYWGGAHTFIYGDSIDRKEMWFSEGWVFFFASRTCLSVCAPESLSRWGIFHPVTPPEMTKENRSCKPRFPIPAGAFLSKPPLQQTVGSRGSSTALCRQSARFAF